MKTPHTPTFIFISLHILIAASCSGVRFSNDPGHAVKGPPATTDAVSVGTRGAYPPWHGAVTVYYNRQELEGLRCEKLGVVTARSPYSSEEERSELIVNLQQQAADLGANAILLLEQDNEKDRLAGRLKAEALRVVDRNML